MQEKEFFLKMKCARAIDRFAKEAHVSLSGALKFFYESSECSGLRDDMDRIEEMEEKDLVNELMKAYHEKYEEE